MFVFIFIDTGMSNALAAENIISHIYWELIKLINILIFTRFFFIWSRIEEKNKRNCTQRNLRKRRKKKTRKSFKSRILSQNAYNKKVLLYQDAQQFPSVSSTFSLTFFACLLALYINFLFKKYTHILIDFTPNNIITFLWLIGLLDENWENCTAWIFIRRYFQRHVIKFHTWIADMI